MKRVILLLACCAALPAQEVYDLVVYGATSGGVMTAVSGARRGLRTVLLEPGNHIGGNGHRRPSPAPTSAGAK